MKYLIAQGIRQHKLVKTPFGFRNTSNVLFSPLQRGTHLKVNTLGNGVKRHISPKERYERDSNRDIEKGEGLKHKKKSIKPLKFRM